jgi:hypothetical protein
MLMNEPTFSGYGRVLGGALKLFRVTRRPSLRIIYGAILTVGRAGWEGFPLARCSAA